jgi:hypothetical protein
MALVMWLRMDHDNDASHGHNLSASKSFLEVKPQICLYALSVDLPTKKMKSNRILKLLIWKILPFKKNSKGMQA